MRSVHWANLEKRRPVVVLTRERMVGRLTRITVAPVTSTIRGLQTEVIVDERNGLDHESVINCDNITTIPLTTLGARIGRLTSQQESELARAVVVAFDLMA